MNAQPDRDERFADWVDGRLTADETAEFERELRSDPSLRSAAADYRATVEMLRGRLRGGECAPLNLADSVLAAVGGESDSSPAGAGPRRWMAWVSLAAAASLVFYMVVDGEGSAAPVSELAKTAAAPAGEDASASSEALPAESVAKLGRALRLDFGNRTDRQAAASKSGAEAGPEESEPQGRTWIRERARSPAPESVDEDEPVVAGKVDGYTATTPAPRLVVVLELAPESLTSPDRENPGDTGLLGLLPEVIPNLTLNSAEHLRPWLANAADVSLLRITDEATPYQLQGGDRVFTVRGTERELPLYFAELHRRLAGTGNRIKPQWVAPRVGLDLALESRAVAAGRTGDQSGGGGPGNQSVLVVVRRAPAGSLEKPAKGK